MIDRRASIPALALRFWVRGRAAKRIASTIACDSIRSVRWRVTFLASDDVNCHVKRAEWAEPIQPLTHQAGTLGTQAGHQMAHPRDAKLNAGRSDQTRLPKSDTASRGRLRLCSYLWPSIVDPSRPRCFSTSIQGRERNCQSIIDGNSWTISGLEDSDALRRPNQVGSVENVQQRNPVRHFADVRHVESSLSGQIDLGHVR